MSALFPDFRDSRCCWCRRIPVDFRLTLPRKAQDLVFDRWQCHEEWREEARGLALLEE